MKSSIPVRRNFLKKEEKSQAQGDQPQSARSSARTDVTRVVSIKESSKKPDHKQDPSLNLPEKTDKTQEDTASLFSYINDASFNDFSTFLESYFTKDHPKILDDGITEKSFKTVSQGDAKNDTDDRQKYVDEQDQERDPELQALTHPTITARNFYKPNSTDLILVIIYTIVIAWLTRFLIANWVIFKRVFELIKK